MMQRSAPPTFPEALDDDDDDVTWALQTAGVQWKRGAHADAVEWLRRAAESAVDGGRAIRARDLTQSTNALEAALRTGWVPRLTPSGHPADSSRSPGSGRAPASSRAPGSGRTFMNSRAPESSPPPASARPFPLRTPKPPANPFVPPGNPFASSPALNPFSSAPASMRRGGVSEYDASDALESDAYGELAVDIDVEAESVAPHARREPQPTELSDDELVEELDDFDEMDVAALSAARRPLGRAPLVSAPELETGVELEAEFDLEASEYTEEGEDDDRPTLPPSSSSKNPQVVVPNSLRDEIDELLGKSSRHSSRAAPPPSTREPAPQVSKQSRAKNARPAEPQLPEEDEPTERSLEAAPEQAPFAEQPLEETTERDLEPERALEPMPSSRRREIAPESEPGTSPDLRVPFGNSDSTPPTEPSPELPRAPASGTEQPESVQPASETKASPRLSRAPESEPEPPPVSMQTVAAVSEPPIVVTESLLADADSQPQVSEPPLVVSESLLIYSQPPAVVSAPPLAISEPPAVVSDPPAPATISEPASTEPHPNLDRPAEIAGVLLSEVPGLEDLPDESQAQLVRAAAIHTLAASEEVIGFGLALVLDGIVAVMPEVADVAAAQARRGQLVFSQGHLDEGIRMRVVASTSGAQVAAWPYEAFSSAIVACPWVGDELKNVGDRFQALAGVAMGPMGDQLDDMLRGLVVDRCEVKRLLPGEVIAEAGKGVPGMVILGAGRLEIVEGEGVAARVLEELHPGDFLFAPQILQASVAPATARAGKGGALILFAERKIAHELLVGVPPLLGIFAC